MSWLDKLRGKPKVKEPEKPVMPEGVDLAALWEEPSEASAIPTVLGIANAVMLAILLVLKLFGH